LGAYLLNLRIHNKTLMTHRLAKKLLRTFTVPLLVGSLMVETHYALEEIIRLCYESPMGNLIMIAGILAPILLIYLFDLYFYRGE
jgi:uncharacterized PurR-regulated membrane protein YhhQ (DUF165 family)